MINEALILTLGYKYLSQHEEFQEVKLMGTTEAISQTK